MLVFAVACLVVSLESQGGLLLYRWPVFLAAEDLDFDYISLDKVWIARRETLKVPQHLCGVSFCQHLVK